MTLYRHFESKDQLVAEYLRTLQGYAVARDHEAARALYPVARTHWERIETVAESFGDLDPMMDAREADLDSERVGIYAGCGLGGAAALEAAYRSGGRVPPRSRSISTRFAPPSR